MGCQDEIQSNLVLRAKVQGSTNIKERDNDDDCDKIASLIDNVGELIKDALEAGMYKQAVTMYLQLLKVASKREQYQV